MAKSFRHDYMKNRNLVTVKAFVTDGVVTKFINLLMTKCDYENSNKNVLTKWL